MRPLGNLLTNFSDFESDLHSEMSNGHVIGFLLDSRTGDLKKSGLIIHPKAVISLDELLGQKATLFYPDPRRFEPREYAKVIQEFSQNLMGSDYFKFEVTTPALLLMTYKDGQFSRTTTLSLDSLPMCLWHSEIYGFLEEYLGNEQKDPQQGQWWKNLVNTHANIIGVESLKACVAIIISKLTPI